MLKTSGKKKSQIKENPQNSRQCLSGTFASQKSLEQCAPGSKRPQLLTLTIVPNKTICQT